MKNKLFFWLKTTLGFSRKESFGFVILVPILILLAVSPELVRNFKSRKSNLFYEGYIRQIDSLERLGVSLVKSPLPTFNPLDTAKSNSREKVLDRINRIPFLDADSVTLQIVPGIGPSTASRIIRFRENLGGLNSPQQLSEVFGLKPETIEAIWEYFEFQPLIFRKLRVNQLEADELAKHPYISFQEAKVIVAFRKQHGPYISAQDLLKIKIFRQEWIDKISPYLAFD